MLELIAKIIVKSVVTPVLIGGYSRETRTKINGITVDECLRLQSIKGLWRWWLRAYVAGAVREMNIADDKTFISNVRKVEKKLMGHAEAPSVASKFALKLRGTCNIGSMSLGEVKSYPRLRLMLLGKHIERLYYIESINNLSINVYERIFKGERLDSESKRLALISLYSALLFNGIGKAGRRGFGCLEYEAEETEYEIKTENLGHEDIRKILNNGLECAMRILRLKHSQTQLLPPIPAISRETLNVYYVDTSEHTPQNVLIDLQGFTVRTIRSKVLGEDPFRNRLQGWILGMTSIRGVKRKRQWHGYLASVNRRASPLFISVHKKYALISIFKSRDWPNIIRWRSGVKAEEKTLRINAEFLNQAYSTLATSLERYLERQGYSYRKVF